MESKISLLKGLHPGIVLERELQKRKIPKGRFAISLNEFPQSFGDITKGKRKMNTALALKIEHALGIEEGFFMTLQVFFEIKEEKKKLALSNHPDLSKFRPVLFWDTKIEKIDWIIQKEAVIRRVMERGNEIEKKEIQDFYGKGVIDQVFN